MASRPTLSAKRPKHITPEQQQALDVSALMLDPKFRRWVLTVFETAGMYTGSFHPEAGAAHYAMGRRGLGLDILRTLELHSGADAHIRILQEAQPKEATNDRTDISDGRDREPDASSGGRGRVEPEPGVLRYD